MTRITVVIDSPSDGVHLGMELAGGRVVAAMDGDHSDCLEALELHEQISKLGILNAGDLLSDANRKRKVALAKARGEP